MLELNSHFARSQPALALRRRVPAASCSHAGDASGLSRPFHNSDALRSELPALPPQRPMRSAAPQRATTMPSRLSRQKPDAARSTLSRARLEFDRLAAQRGDLEPYALGQVMALSMRESSTFPRLRRLTPELACQRFP